MACLLLDGIPDDFDVDRDDDGFVVSIPAVSEGSVLVTLDVRLDTMLDMGTDTFEFSYSFVIDDCDGGELPHSTQDRYEVQRYFDGLSTEHVLPTVCAALHALVAHVQPAYIYRVTKGIKLPQKALVKHLLITEYLADMGFQVVDEGTDRYDRLFWLLRR